MYIDFEVAAINQAAAVAQRHAGVDPKKCLKLVGRPGGKRTPLEAYLWHGHKGEYAVPDDYEERPYGRVPWRQHDAELHIFRVGALHPELAALSIAASGRAGLLLGAGEIDAAGAIGTNIDYFLANQPLVWEEALHSLVAGSLERDILSSEAKDESARLIVVQSGHIVLLSEVEPMFCPVQLENGTIV